MTFTETETDTLFDLLEGVASARVMTSSERATARGLADRFRGRQTGAPVVPSTTEPVAPTQIDVNALYAARRQKREAISAAHAASMPQLGGAPSC